MFIYMCLALLSFYVLKRILDNFKIDKYGERYVFITGCDTGFGNMLAVRLDDMGFRVFSGCLTNSGKDRLKKVCSKRLLAVDIDVTQDASIGKCLEEVKQKLPANKDNGDKIHAEVTGEPVPSFRPWFAKDQERGGIVLPCQYIFMDIDIEGLWAVVNNAGRLGGIGPSQLLTRKDYEDTLAVNLYGVIFVTNAFLPLVQAEKGRIVNMSSVMGRIFFLDASYCVSKAGVEAFSDVLRRELLGTGVTVHILEPGFYRTTLMDVQSVTQKINTKFERLPQSLQDKLPPNTKQQMLDGIDTVRSWASPDTYQVVDAYVHAITAKFPNPRYLVGTDATVMFRILMYLPECISDLFIRRRGP